MNYSQEELIALMHAHYEEHGGRGPGYLAIEDVARWALKTGTADLSRAGSIQELAKALRKMLWEIRLTGSEMARQEQELKNN